MELIKGQIMEEGITLLDFCMEAATASSESVEKWRRQRRTVERLPSHLADTLFRRLHRRRLLFPSILEVFQLSVEVVDLNDERAVDTEWMAYIGEFCYMRSLNIADCQNINNSAIWFLSGHSRLKELDLSRCSKVTDACIKYLVSITTLEKLCVPETGLTADAVAQLSSLVNLRVLDLGGIPVTDMALSSLQVLKQLEHLDLWGSEISNAGAVIFETFPVLCGLNIAWTKISRLPCLSITSLNMSNCTVHSLVEGDGGASVLLSKLVVSGATFFDLHQVFSSIQTGCLKYLDISYSNIGNFYFLANLQNLEHLDLKFCQITDSLMEQVASSAGEKLRYLNISNTKITSHALIILSGRIPNLEDLSLSHTFVDDESLSYIGMMHSLRIIDLSHTRIRGIANSGNKKLKKPLSLVALQNLSHLRSLNLEDTRVIYKGFQPLSLLTELESLYLKSHFLIDSLLEAIEPLQKLRSLGLQGGAFTDHGLLSYKPPPSLRVFDLGGCCLLSANAISSFCKKHRQVEVRHKHANTSSLASYLTINKVSLSRPRTVKSSMSPLSKPLFVDERIKYSIEELRQLESSPGSSRMPENFDLPSNIFAKR